MLAISKLDVGDMLYTQLASRVLAVIVRRREGWSMYVDAVEGANHDDEWIEVTRSGAKVNKPIALAIAATMFHPGYDAIDCDYVS